VPLDPADPDDTPWFLTTGLELDFTPGADPRLANPAQVDALGGIILCRKKISNWFIEKPNLPTAHIVPLDLNPTKTYRNSSRRVSVTTS